MDDSSYPDYYKPAYPSEPPRARPSWSNDLEECKPSYNMGSSRLCVVPDYIRRRFERKSGVEEDVLALEHEGEVLQYLLVCVGELEVIIEKEPGTERAKFAFATALGLLRHAGLSSKVVESVIVIGGYQGQGKSTLLNCIVRRLLSFAKMDTIATTRPLRVTVLPARNAGLVLRNGLNVESVSLSELRTRIKLLMDETKGRIVDDPIDVEVFSPAALYTRTYLDLPGFVEDGAEVDKNAKAQGNAAHEVAKEMYERYCKDPNNLVLFCQKSGEDLTGRRMPLFDALKGRENLIYVATRFDENDENLRGEDLAAKVATTVRSCGKPICFVGLPVVHFPENADEKDLKDLEVKFVEDLDSKENTITGSFREKIVAFDSRVLEGGIDLGLAGLQSRLHAVERRRVLSTLANLKNGLRERSTIAQDRVKRLKRVTTVYHRDLENFFSELQNIVRRVLRGEVPSSDFALDFKTEVELADRFCRDRGVAIFPQDCDCVLVVPASPPPEIPYADPQPKDGARAGRGEPQRNHEGKSEATGGGSGATTQQSEAAAPSGDKPASAEKPTPSPSPLPETTKRAEKSSSLWSGSLASKSPGVDPTWLAQKRMKMGMQWEATDFRTLSRTLVDIKTRIVHVLIAPTEAELRGAQQFCTGIAAINPLSAVPPTLRRIAFDGLHLEQMLNYSLNRVFFIWLKTLRCAVHHMLTAEKHRVRYAALLSLKTFADCFDGSVECFVEHQILEVRKHLRLLFDSEMRSSVDLLELIQHAPLMRACFGYQRDNLVPPGIQVEELGEKMDEVDTIEDAKEDSKVISITKNLVMTHVDFRRYCFSRNVASYLEYAVRLSLGDDTASSGLNADDGPDISSFCEYVEFFLAKEVKARVDGEKDAKVLTNPEEIVAYYSKNTKQDDEVRRRKAQESVCEKLGKLAGIAGRLGALVEDHVDSFLSDDPKERREERGEKKEELGGESKLPATMLQMYEQLQALLDSRSGTGDAGVETEALRSDADGRTAEEVDPAHVGALNAKLAKLGKRVENVESHGNCMFDAVAHQVLTVEAESPAQIPRGTDPAVKELGKQYRKFAVITLQHWKRVNFAQTQHASDMVKALCDESRVKDLAEYAAKIQKDGVWGGQLALVALLGSLNARATVHSVDGSFALEVQRNAKRDLNIGFLHGRRKSGAADGVDRYGHYVSVVELEENGRSS